MHGSLYKGALLLLVHHSPIHPSVMKSQVHDDLHTTTVHASWMDYYNNYMIIAVCVDVVKIINIQSLMIK